MTSQHGLRSSACASFYVYSTLHIRTCSVLVCACTSSSVSGALYFVHWNIFQDWTQLVVVVVVVQLGHLLSHRWSPFIYCFSPRELYIYLLGRRLQSRHLCVYIGSAASLKVCYNFFCSLHSFFCCFAFTLRDTTGCGDLRFRHDVDCLLLVCRRLWSMPTNRWQLCTFR